MQSTRRQLLFTFTGITGLCALGWRTAAIQDSALPATATANALLRLIDDRRQARNLGRSYLGAHPAENRPDVLSAQLQRAVFKHPSASGKRRGWLWSAFDATVKSEFGVGEVVRLDGWIVARSEARLCALYTL